MIQVQLISERPLGPDGRLIWENGKIVRSACGAEVEDHSRVIGARLGLLLEKRFSGVQIINIHFDARKGESIVVNGGVVDLRRSFECADYSELSSAEKFKRLSEFMLASVQAVADHLRMKADLNPLKAELGDENLCNLFKGKALKSKDGRQTAQIEVRQGFNVASVELRVFGNGAERRTTIAQTSPDEWIFRPFLGPLKLAGEKVELEMLHDGKTSLVFDAFDRA